MDRMNTRTTESLPGRRCGAVGLPDGSVRWRVWAPLAGRVDLVLIDGERRRTVAMRPDDNNVEEPGHFAHVEPNVPDGQRYAYKLDGGEERQDPCSLSQPDGVPGPSAVVRPARFSWTDANWRGVRRADLVFYELHVGTFTPAGTFDAVIERLPALKELGVTAIEIMPVNQFPGSRNWGYDGVLSYAAQNTYGGPHGLARLVDACHAHGLAAVLDVVYNHFGPEANFLHEFGPYFTEKYKTPWGKAVNFDDAGSDAVRDFVLDNARMWLEEFHFDGLRLDAVHAIYDLGARHILRAIRDVADDVAARQNRDVHVVAESDLNDPRIVNPPERGGHGHDAQWSDDFHHAVHAFLTGERRGYYADYGAARQLAHVLNTPFLHAGHYSPGRRRKHGAPPTGLPGDQFVVCIQNHDQVGNRAKGDRLTTLLASPAKQRLAASLLLLAPHLPLLFMGEEYGEDRPFPFFCSFAGEDLTRAVREGRKREFAELVGGGEEVPLPDALETFQSAVLSWTWPDGTPRAGIRRLYADLLAARRAWPAMRDFTNRTARLLGQENDGAVIELARGTGGDSLSACFNLTDRPQALPAGGEGGTAQQ
ncbi:MAG: GH13_10 / GH13 / GH13_9 / GH13_36 / GH13_ 11 / GH13_20, partial [uncultured Phycisphaerae bacterium]